MVLGPERRCVNHNASADLWGAREILHFLKKQMPAMLRESYRPISLTHPIPGVVVDIVWHHRCAACCYDQVGPHQTRGRAGAEEAVVGVVHIIVVRAGYNVVTFAIPWDVKYGYDGGQHADIIVECREATLPPAGGLLVADALRTDKAQVRLGSTIGGVLHAWRGCPSR